MTIVFVGIALALGITAVVQVGINSDLRSLIGNPYQTALISTTVSTVFLIALSTVAYHRPYPDMQVVRDANWWMWTGGVIGALFVAGGAGVGSPPPPPRRLPPPSPGLLLPGARGS